MASNEIFLMPANHAADATQAEFRGIPEEGKPVNSRTVPKVSFDAPWIVLYRVGFFLLLFQGSKFTTEDTCGKENASPQGSWGRILASHTVPC